VIFEGSVPAPLPAAVEVGLYRIAQEALQNALRHADASRVVIRLEASPDRVRLTIEDDGRGFVIGEESSASRFGLIGMRERARLLGGSFELESSPGAGTRVTAEVGIR
jgi:two-component system NarL family sensor kinase